MRVAVGARYPVCRAVGRASFHREIARRPGPPCRHARRPSRPPSWDIGGRRSTRPRPVPHAHRLVSILPPDPPAVNRIGWGERGRATCHNADPWGRRVARRRGAGRLPILAPEHTESAPENDAPGRIFDNTQIIAVKRLVYKNLVAKREAPNESSCPFGTPGPMKRESSGGPGRSQPGSGRDGRSDRVPPRTSRVSAPRLRATGATPWSSRVLFSEQPNCRNGRCISRPFSGPESRTMRRNSRTEARPATMIPKVGLIGGMKRFWRGHRDG